VLIAVTNAQFHSSLMQVDPFTAENVIQKEDLNITEEDFRSNLQN